MKRQLPTSNENAEVDAMILPSLYRLTAGIPRKELKMMVSEAMMCEEALENEIKQIEDALKSPPDSEAGKRIQYMLDSEITPPDRFFTVSSLLGRLRDDLATPLPPNSIIPEMRARTGLVPPPPKKKKKENPPPDATTDGGDGMDAEAVSTSSTTLEKQKKVLSLSQNPEYTKEHSEPTVLMSLWKKISSHRSSIVFRRPVNPKEAPGYTDRIVFPMDLSLIRKMIVARQIRSFSDLHQRLGLICHNCVKYNGRESDYGVVTRDFESNVDEMMVNAVLAAAADPQQAPESTSQSTGEAKTVTTDNMETELSSNVTKTNEERPTTATSSANVIVKTEPVGDIGLNAKDTQSTEKEPVASASTKQNESKE